MSASTKQENETENWKQTANYGDFIKWAYKTSPYRVVACVDGRGHWRAVFTSVYPGDSYLIRGNNGGGKRGRMMAVAAAKEFMRENQYGCPPPGEYE